jgi:hypothetical protein
MNNFTILLPYIAKELTPFLVIGLTNITSLISGESFLAILVKNYKHFLYMCPKSTH